MESLFFRIMTKITGWLDPKLEKFRPKKVELPYTPESEKDFTDLLKRVPHKILSVNERKTLMGVLAARDLLARDIMVPKREMAFIKTDEKLAPVTLNRLYKSGCRNFPVLNSEKQICGILHSDIFDVDKMSDDNAIERYIDPKILYMREDYTAKEVMSAFLRSGTNYSLVLDENMRIKGSIYLPAMLEKILGFAFEDNFYEDFNAIEVANRKK